MSATDVVIAAEHLDATRDVVEAAGGTLVGAIPRPDSAHYTLVTTGVAAGTLRAGLHAAGITAVAIVTITP